jgi:hypothetical protein
MLSALVPLLDALLRSPPATHASLLSRVAPHPLAAVRRAVTDRIISGQLTPDQTDALPLLFRVLSPGGQRPRLEALLLNPQASHSKRTMALAALFHDLQAKRLIDGLDPQIRIVLGDPWLRPMVRLAEHDREASDALADTLTRTLPRLQGVLLDQIERLRVQIGGAAMPVYTRALQRADLARWWPKMIGLVLAAEPTEGTPRPPSNVVALFESSGA